MTWGEIYSKKSARKASTRRVPNMSGSLSLEGAAPKMHRELRERRSQGGKETAPAGNLVGEAAAWRGVWWAAGQRSCFRSGSIL